jgi:hypothetical protein
VYVTVTSAFNADGSGLSVVIVVVVFALFTVCVAPSDVLPLKFGSPPYVAVNVREPAPVNLITHWPADTKAVHDSVPPLAVTVTLPVGVPPPDVTVYATVTSAFRSDGSGLSERIVVVVFALFTVCVTPGEVLPL